MVLIIYPGNNLQQSSKTEQAKYHKPNSRIQRDNRIVQVLFY